MRRAASCRMDLIVMQNGQPWAGRCRRRKESAYLPTSFCSHQFLILIGMNDLVVQAIEGQLQPVADAQLVVDLAQIILDHLLGGSQLVGNLLVALALGDAGDDGHLLGRELGLDARVDQGGGLGAISLDDPADRLIVDPGFAGRDAAHAAHQQVGRDGAADDAANAAAVQLDGLVFVGWPRPAQSASHRGQRAAGRE